jgi:pimeloyl-ACP methyl ester carboxylesterase
MHDITTSGAACEPMPTVIALHCSGSGGYEWRRLTRVLGQRLRVIAPDLIGCGASGHWTGTHAFTAGPDGRAALSDIMALAGKVDRAVLCGAHWAAAELFIDHWNGAGSFAGMEPDAQAAVVRYIPKACLEFRAMAEEPTALSAYRRFNFPVLLLLGEHTSEPVRLIGRQLAKAIKRCSQRTVFGAGHMGPFTHAAIVNTMIADHILRTDPGTEATLACTAVRLAA